MIVVRQEFIHADDHFCSGLDLSLECGGGLRDLALEPAAFDAPHHASDGRDLREERLCLAFQLIGERLDVVGPAERIDHFGHAGFMRENLLRPQRDLHRLLGGKRQRLVE